MTPERIDNGITVWSKRIGLILIGWFAADAYHGTLGLYQKAAQLKVEQTQVIPKLASVAGCQAKRAQIATNEAVKANAEGADVDIAAIPNCPAPKIVIPKPNAAR